MNRTDHIWFRYHDGSDWVAWQFNPLTAKPVPSVTRVTGDTLRGRRYAHRTGGHRQWQIELGADQMFVQAGAAVSGVYPTTTDFILAWWLAGRKEIAFDDGSTEPEEGWIEIDTAEDDFPVDFVEGVEFLPTLSFVAIEKARITFPDE